MHPTLEQNLPLIPIALGFAAILVLATIWNKRQRRKNLRYQGQLTSSDGSRPSIEGRLAYNPTWASGEIRSSGFGLVLGVWLLVVVWNLTFGISFVKAFSNPSMKTGGLIALGVFALLGIVPLYFAVRFTIRHFRFGLSWCCIREKAGVLGKEMTGHVRTSNRIEAIGDYVVNLECIESITTGSGKNRTTKLNVHWSAQQVVPKEGKNSSAGIPFSFTLPDYPPETACQLARGDVSWILRIQVPVKGVDFATQFTVPVFKME